MVSDCTLKYTDVSVNVTADPFYTNLTVSSFDHCLDSCTSDYKCLGVSYDSGQCLLSKKNLRVTSTVPCNTCRFSGKFCNSSGSIVVNRTTMPPTISNDVTSQKINASPNDVKSKISLKTTNDVKTKNNNTTLNDDTTQDIKMSLKDITTQDSNTSENSVQTHKSNASSNFCHNPNFQYVIK